MGSSISSSNNAPTSKQSIESQKKVAKEYNNYLKEESKVAVGVSSSQLSNHNKSRFESNNQDDDDSEEDEENYVEQTESQRAGPSFLMNLPGVTATDSMGYRIEALRVYLENQLGDIPFLAAYKHLVVRLNIKTTIN